MGTDVRMERGARENKNNRVFKKKEKIQFSSVIELCFPSFHLSFAVHQIIALKCTW